jgi:hypothetical protein
MREIRELPEYGDWLGPEAHQDEFSTFNRGVVGSTPTRPTMPAKRRRPAHSFGKAEVVSSILTAGSFGGIA